MKSISRILKPVCAFLCISGAAASLNAQSLITGADVPHTFSYQGLLAESDRTPVADGEYRITVALYADPTGTLKVWEDSYNATVSGGIFNLQIGSGNAPLPDAATMNRPLWIGTRIGDTPEMYPLTPLSASPYALNVRNGAITSDKLADGAVTADKVDMDYIAGIAVNGQPVSAKGNVLNIEGSKDIALTYNNETNTLQLSRPTPATRGDGEKGTRTLASPLAWDSQGDLTDGTTGGQTTTAGDWIGTSANPGNGTYDFEIRVNNERTMLYQPNGTNTPNIVGGYGGNTITASSSGGTIAGGGNASNVNQITNNVNYATIGGGRKNTASGNHSTIAGGYGNTVSGSYSTTAGGYNNLASGGWSVIGGGDEHVASGINATIAGGYDNTASSSFSTVGGGQVNSAGAAASTIPGGDHLSTTSYAQTAVGFYNAPRGSLISRPTSATVQTINDPLFMVGNGGSGNPSGGSNAFEVSYNGHSTVYGTNQPGPDPFRGATYTDNIIYAWGYVNVLGAIETTFDFGIAAVNNPAPGVFEVTINLKDPVTGNTIPLQPGTPMAVTATLVAEYYEHIQSLPSCGDIRVTRFGYPTPNTFTVYTFSGQQNGQCQMENIPFMFHITGRP